MKKGSNPPPPDIKRRPSPPSAPPVKKMFNKEQITLVRQAIIDGVEDARNNGVNCGYPNCFTIEETHDGKTISVSYPLFSNEPDFDIEAPKPIY